MFYVDKYAPTTVDTTKFHKNELSMLDIMSKDDAVPHLIFYGPEGSGKKTVIHLFLEMLYDKYVHNLTDAIYTVTGSGNTTTQVTVKQSNYHIVIEPNNTNFDRYLIQDVVKEYAKRRPLDVFTAKKTFKTVLINNVDNLSYYAQTSLRRTMELYSSTCRFIMWSRSLSKVIEPLQSRCYCFRINSPTEDELLEMALDVSAKERLTLSLSDLMKIVVKAKGNVKKVLWFLQFHSFGMDYETSYDEVIDEIIKYVVKADLRFGYTIRELLYKILITNIPGTCIVKDVVDKLMSIPTIPTVSKVNIVELAAKFEHNLIRGRREIIHLEGFIDGVIIALDLANCNNGSDKEQHLANSKELEQAVLAKASVVVPAKPSVVVPAKPSVVVPAKASVVVPAKASVVVPAKASVVVPAKASILAPAKAPGLAKQKTVSKN